MKRTLASAIIAAHSSEKGVEGEICKVKVDFAFANDITAAELASARARMKAQGIDREATTHLGPTATEMERRGAASDRGDGNRQAQANNAERARLEAWLWVMCEKTAARMKAKGLCGRKLGLSEAKRAEIAASVLRVDGRCTAAPFDPAFNRRMSNAAGAVDQIVVLRAKCR